MDFGSWPEAGYPPCQDNTAEDLKLVNQDTADTLLEVERHRGGHIYEQSH